MKLSKVIYHYDELTDFMKSGISIIDIYGKTPFQALKGNNEANKYGVWTVTYTEKKNRTNAKVKK